MSPDDDGEPAPHPHLARGWDRGLHRQFPCGGRVVVVSLASLRNDDGSLRFVVRWQPGPPDRMPPDLVEEFEAGRRLAEHAIRTHLESRR